MRNIRSNASMRGKKRMASVYWLTDLAKRHKRRKCGYRYLA
ncbi:MAG: hypothetical protein ACXWWA_14495 [Chitinophagaceae bacterium]